VLRHSSYNQSVRRATAVLLVTAVTALATTACGSSSSGQRAAETPYGPKSSPAAMSRCMRANGLTSFPDPVASAGGVGFPGGVLFGGADELTVDGVVFAGPALKTAEKACSVFLPHGPPPQISESQKVKMLAEARCIRQHGVPNFPDPTFPLNGPQANGPRQSPVQASPALTRAAVACGLATKGGRIAFGG
jgi:hypothetical protein